MPQRECISTQSLTSLGCIKISVPQTVLRSPITTKIQKVKKMNISFVKLGEEECERCDLHERHLETHKPKEVPNDGKENNKRT